MSDQNESAEFDWRNERKKVAGGDRTTYKTLKDVPKGTGVDHELGLVFLRHRRGGGHDKMWYNCKFCTAIERGPQTHPGLQCRSNPANKSITKFSDLKKIKRDPSAQHKATVATNGADSD